MRIKHQVAINATETIKNLERLVIKGYHTDNGIFNPSDIMEDLLKKQKNVRFSGDRASHKNGTAERTIKMIVTMARTMLMPAIYSDLQTPSAQTEDDPY